MCQVRGESGLDSRLFGRKVCEAEELAVLYPGKKSLSAPSLRVQSTSTDSYLSSYLLMWSLPFRPPARSDCQPTGFSDVPGAAYNDGNRRTRRAVQDVNGYIVTGIAPTHARILVVFERCPSEASSALFPGHVIQNPAVRSALSD